MRESPRIRRLRSDYKAMLQLASESSIIQFATRGDPPDLYTLRFNGNGVWRPDGSGDPLIHEMHEVDVNLSASYPRMQPELSWKSPIFHPNISASGVVCLGGYGTYWVPSVALDDLVTMLWDMIRYQNYDVESPYNREAANWAKMQYLYQLPLDPRPLRDRVAGFAPPVEDDLVPIVEPQANTVAEVTFIEPQVVPAEMADPEDPDILFID